MNSILKINANVRSVVPEFILDKPMKLQIGYANILVNNFEDIDGNLFSIEDNYLSSDIILVRNMIHYLTIEFFDRLQDNYISTEVPLWFLNMVRISPLPRFKTFMPPTVIKTLGNQQNREPNRTYVIAGSVWLECDSRLINHADWVTKRFWISPAQKIKPRLFNVISSDKTTSYTVRIYHNFKELNSCNCIGFSFHKHCKHIDTAYKHIKDELIGISNHRRGEKL